jgi:hypothetical protein
MAGSGVPGVSYDVERVTRLRIQLAPLRKSFGWARLAIGDPIVVAGSVEYGLRFLAVAPQRAVRDRRRRGGTAGAFGSWWRMRKRTAIGAILTFAGLAVCAIYFGWAIHSASRIGEGWKGLDSAWPYLLAGVFTVGCVLAAFVWLAFFSERRGYDDRVGGPEL